MKSQWENKYFRLVELILSFILEYRFRWELYRKEEWYGFDGGRNR